MTANTFWDCWLRFLEHSQLDDSTVHKGASAHEEEAASECSDASDSSDLLANQSELDGKEGEGDSLFEESPSFFDELHARIAPSRSLKKQFFTEETLERYVHAAALLHTYMKLLSGAN